MLDKVSMFREYVIMPIEEKRNQLRKEILKENIFSRSQKMRILKKYDELLIEKYQKLEKLIEEASGEK